MNPPPAIGVYIINLDRVTDRWARVEPRMAAFGWPVVRISALDAKTDPEAVLALRGLAIRERGAVLRFSTFCGRAFILAEEACFQSHLIALRAFLAGPHSHGLIVEDDVIAQADLRAVVTDAARAGADIVKLEAANWAGTRRALDLGPAGARRLVASFRASSGSAAYLVSRRGAEKLLAGAGPRFEAYDDYLCNIAAHGARSLDVSPMPVEQEKFETYVHIPELEFYRPLTGWGRARFAAKRGWRRLRRAWMVLRAGRFRVWRIARYPWWMPEAAEPPAGAPPAR